MKTRLMLLGSLAVCACGPVSSNPDAGSDGGKIDAGTPDAGGDAGVLPLDAGQPTCQSNNFYNPNFEVPGELMNPGLSCPSCHLANQLFYVAFTYAGTVMPALHEKDLCKSPPPDGGRVEILELDGGLWWSFFPNSSGNFRTLDAGPSPFVARLSVGASTRQSVSTHTSGDCNSCHTEQGARSAAGRLTFP